LTNKQQGSNVDLLPINYYRRKGGNSAVWNSLWRYLGACCGCKKKAFFEGNTLTNEVRVIKAEKPDAGVSKTSKVVQLYNSTRQESKVNQLPEAC